MLVEAVRAVRACVLPPKVAPVFNNPDTGTLNLLRPEGGGREMDARLGFKLIGTDWRGKLQGAKVA